MRLILLVVTAAAIVLGAVWAAGASPAETFSSLLKGALGSPGAIEGTLKEFVPLLLAGIAVFVGLKAGLFNIGVEGQFMMGAMVCAAVALRIPGPWGILLGVILGALAGGLWALPAAWIKAYRNGHEVITTIMLNNIAVQITTALVVGPLKDPSQQGTTTASLPATALLPSFGTQPKVSVAIPLGLLMVAALWVYLTRTVKGYELQAVGQNAKAAVLAGISAQSVTFRAMVGSGVIGGVAGAIQVVAFEGRFYEGFSSGYGFDALGVALLAGGHPFLLIPSAFGFGVLTKGATTIQVLQGVPKGISFVILGLLIVVFAAIRYRKAQGREN